jgi:hypothetical protein
VCSSDLVLFSGRINASSGFGTITFDAPSPAGVPEPSTWALMIAGFGGAGAMLRRRSAAARA